MSGVDERSQAEIFYNMIHSAKNFDFESANKLLQASTKKYLFRISTSCPGLVTVQFKDKEEPQKGVATRLAMIKNSSDNTFRLTRVGRDERLTLKTGEEQFQMLKDKINTLSPEEFDSFSKAFFSDAKTLLTPLGIEMGDGEEASLENCLMPSETNHAITGASTYTNPWMTGAGAGVVGAGVVPH